MKEFINKYGEKILKFILNSRRNFALTLTIGFALTYLFFMITEDKDIKKDPKIDDITESISDNEESIKKLDSTINEVLRKVDNVNANILEMESQKTIIKEIYYEKINRVSNYNDAELDSFFSNRYGYGSR